MGPAGPTGPLASSDYVVVESDTLQVVPSGGSLDISNRFYLSSPAFVKTSEKEITILSPGTYRLDYKIECEGVRDAAVFLDNCIIESSHYFCVQSGEIIGTTILKIGACDAPTVLTLKNTSTLPMVVPRICSDIYTGYDHSDCDSASNIYLILVKLA